MRDLDAIAKIHLPDGAVGTPGDPEVNPNIDGVPLREAIRHVIERLPEDVREQTTISVAGENNLRYPEIAKLFSSL